MFEVEPKKWKIRNIVIDELEKDKQTTREREKRASKQFSELRLGIQLDDLQKLRKINLKWANLEYFYEGPLKDCCVKCESLIDKLIDTILQMNIIKELFFHLTIVNYPEILLRYRTNILSNNSGVSKISRQYILFMLIKLIDTCVVV